MTTPKPTSRKHAGTINNGIFGNFGAGNYCEIGDDGHLLMHGEAFHWAVVYGQFVLSKLGNQDKPDYDDVEMGHLFPDNKDTEWAEISFRMPPDKKLGTQVRFAVEYVQSTVSVPTFIMEGRYYYPGQQVPDTWSVFTTDNGPGPIHTYISGEMLQILPFEMLPSGGVSPDESIGAMVDIKLYRQEGDAVAGDVLVKNMSMGYKKDSIGSRTETEK